MCVSLRHALSEIKQNYNSVNWWRNRVFVPYVFGTLSRFHPSYPGYEDAVRVVDEDWDNLIVLDACRPDVFRRVADADQFDSITTRISLGSHSSEWTRRNFGDGQFGDIVYVSANPHTSLVAGDAFHTIIELWTSDYDDEDGVVTPEQVYDAACDAYEQYPDKRLIIHFMQPHGPFIGSSRHPPFEDAAEYWQAYEENLEYVLPYVERLIEKIPGRTVVTADHGQIYAEGIRDKLGIGGHKPRLRFPGLVEVPWAVVDGQRREIREGDISEATGDQITERLEDLGYL